MNLTHPANCLTFNLQRTTRRLMRGFEEAAKTAGLTAPQFTTLSLIEGFGEITITHLAERLGTDRTTMTRNLDLLTRKGWVTEAESEDARLRILKLTKSGAAKLHAALPIWTKFQTGLVDNIGADTAMDLLTTLKKI
jgi:DNA-binding MarR family transcriptional regulator